MTVMTYAQAALTALAQEMERDPTVWVLGEDLGPEGGVAGQYIGLQQRFGKTRVVDTPISENTIMGAAIGAAMCGTRPVVELRYADFGICAADEIVNQAAKIRYMLGGQVRVPAVIRQPIGLRDGMAAQHSQSTEAWWIHVPGLVVIAPATPADNHALLKAAVRCDDPVVYMEHKELWTVTGEVDEHATPAALGKAAVVRSGTDVTVVTWSSMLGVCLAAAEDLAAEGCKAEVIDLRTLWPWDRETVFSSIEKTGRLLVVHQAVRVGGFGGEIVAEAAESLFDKLKAPPCRLGAPRVPVPYSEPLEALCRVARADIVSAARAMMTQLQR
jgi:acetoin:2,6-dichlorophenolindophenol oxidoreductase subunit beta